MKVQVKEKMEFTPFEINITIESRAELNALLDLSRRNLTIPKLMDKGNKKYVETFLDSIRTILLKNQSYDKA